MKKLFAVYIGGKFEEGFIEDHDIIFVVAKNKDEAKQIAKQKTKIKNDVHTDGIAEIIKIDGYKVKLSKDLPGNEIIYDKSYQSI